MGAAEAEPPEGPGGSPRPARRPPARRGRPGDRATLPELPRASPSDPSPDPPSNSRLYIALGGIVALLVLGVIAAVLLRPSPTGLIVIDVPEAARGGVRVELNGRLLTERDGGVLREWPQVRSAPVGKATVRLSAPGYQPSFEVVEVKASEPAELKKPLRRTAPAP